MPGDSWCDVDSALRVNFLDFISHRDYEFNQSGIHRGLMLYRREFPRDDLEVYIC